MTTNDCTLSGVSCDSVALKNVEQTWSGVNKVNGIVKAASALSVTDKLQVDGVIKVRGTNKGVDIDNVYDDSLYRASDTAQVDFSLFPWESTFFIFSKKNHLSALKLRFYL